jgi:uncharacterized membrane protein YfcA
MIGTGVAVAAILLAAVTVQSVSGFGLALLAVPLLSFVIDPKVAVVLLAIVGPLSTISIAFAEREHVLWSLVLRMAGPALLGMPIGFWILTKLGARALEVMIGVLVIVLTGLLVSRVRLWDRSGVDVAAGFASGILATSTGTNGPPLVIVLHAKHLSPPRFRATVSATLVVEGLVTLAVFAIGGRIDAEVWKLVLFAIPGLVVGRFAGTWVVRRLDPERFRILVVALLFATAIALLVDALLG